MKVGERIPLKGVDVQLLTAAGDRIKSPLPGANKPNPLCATEPAAIDDSSENARSLGTLFTSETSVYRFWAISLRRKNSNWLVQIT